MSQFVKADFWAFSLAQYSKEESKNSFLWMQDNLNLNINLLLLSMYLLETGHLISLTQYIGLYTYLGNCELPTSTLRNTRREIGKKGKYSQAYRDALQRELNAEKVEQHVLIEYTNTLSDLHNAHKKLSEKEVQEHLSMLFEGLSKFINNDEPICDKQESSYHANVVINNYLLNK